MAKDLPPRENALFKRIIKCYENKQYKTGLKHARQILSNTKFHEHGETLAMMGLTLNCLGRKEEAYDNVKKGLRNNLQSHVCWHVFGLLQRSDKKYEEAIKCYRNALRWDKDNLQILRDLSLLQIQTRDLEGYKMTRHQLLMLRANQRAGWIGYAVSLHILGEYESALNVLTTFRKTQETNKGKPTDYEYSELLLYEASILIEAGKYKEALAHIATHQDSILDTQSWLEMAGDLLFKLGHYDDAILIYEKLISRNPENENFLDSYIRAHHPQSVDEQLDLCDKFREAYPKADTPILYALKHSTGERFERNLHRYFQKQLRKGVTPLFDITKHLLKDPAKMETIERTILQYCEYLEKNQKFTEDSEGTELPVAYLHVMLYLAQLYDYKNDFKLALYYIDRAIMHTPTYIDPYTIKSKIYKHAGNMTEAVTWMDEARTLDLADRYLNCKCAKYMLRAGMLKKAEETCAFFTREGQPAVENLNEMQCMWFLTESAKAYYRRKDWANTLKKCHEIEKHFVDIVEDQFDFHPYSMRKMTLRAYIGLLRLEDSIRAQDFYNQAAEIAIKTYLHLDEKPYEAINGHGTGNHDQISEKERKKLESKRRKAAAKKKQNQDPPKNDQKNKNTSGGANQNENENLPPPINGDELAKTEHPLDEAISFLDHLRYLSPDFAPTHNYAFQIYHRKGKLLLMIQSVLRALQHHPDDPAVLLHIPQLHTYVKTKSEVSGVAKEIVDAKMSELVPNGNIDQWILSQQHRHSKSLTHTFMLSCARAYLYPETVEEERKRILNFDTTSSDLKSCIYVLEHLRAGKLSPSMPDIETFIACCRETYPQSTAFSPVPPEERSRDQVNS